MQAPRVDTIFASRTRPLSFEIFPPKGDLTVEQAREVVAGLAPLRPDFVSVTCSAGGSGNASGTTAVAAMVQDEFGIPAVAHLTCRGLTHESLAKRTQELKDAGIVNVLALRGDPVPGEPEPVGDYGHASDVIPELVDAGFCVGAAAYPEGHIGCVDLADDVRRLREKQDAGASFFVTQLCFDDEAIFRFLEKCRRGGITVPITCGIMPFMSKAQLSRMVFMCAASLPSPVIRLLARHEDDPEALRAAGVDYAVEQLLDLSRFGVSGLHLYTMNKPAVARACVERIHRR
ncbi:methylenetetrahydrofolate reductase [uncultured Parolsenella sp.]|uniref:methylenetetrahydrofolate reductase n=1 Tax=uncultured Parolsenella sp. TaxID=2083008 RepID=UPI0027D9626F|nr:methylenetetrahydrofolate reductase [uncultured Parolsenella sp.]